MGWIITSKLLLSEDLALKTGEAGGDGIFEVDALALSTGSLIF